ncbi:MAG: S8 family serine peptidase [Pyrinomonadaceae bacterium]
MKPSKLRILGLGLGVFSILVMTSLTYTSPSAAGDSPIGNESASVTESWQSKVDASVLSKASAGQTEFLIYMDNQADLSGADVLLSKEAKGEYVYRQLTEVAQATQPAVKQTLQTFGAEFRSFWVTNAIWAKGDLAVVQALALRPEVGYIYASGGGSLSLPPQARPTENPNSLLAADPAPEPGLLKVNADDVWALGVLGRGVVVAGSDTGVAWRHAALKKQYRGWNEATQTANHSYNWHDAIHNPNTPCGPDTVEPCDDDEILGGGHGTHTVGTMVGDDGGSNRIGMAPEAQWIACRNMNNGAGVIPMYLECMQWFLAPTDINGQNPDPAKSPHVINNSWGCVEGCPPPALQDTLRASRSAGIFYAVSAGNDGGEGPIFLCNTIYHPLARYPEAFTVGATNYTTDAIAEFSSRGSVLGDPAAPTGMIKPNISAPGVSIRSALRDGSYGSLSGTSMAGPHVAGLVALLISANPKLAGLINRLEDIIEQTAVPKTTTEGCGLDSPTAIPNNTFGWGRIDALAAVLEALPPQANNDFAVTPQRTAVTINVLANDSDPDGDQLTITSVGAATHGTVINNGNGTLTYVPEGTFKGIDTFVYTICAPEGCLTASSTAAVTVEVRAKRK